KRADRTSSGSLPMALICETTCSSRGLSGDGPGGAGGVSHLLGAGAGVIAITLRLAPRRVSGRHRTTTGGAAQEPLEQRPELVADLGASAAAVPLEQRLRGLPGGLVDDGGVLAVVDGALVADLARIGHVRQQPVQRRPGELLASALLVGFRDPALVGSAAALQLLDHRQ